MVRIVAQLRGPGGCPWDQEQTSRSLTPYIIEEAHELVDAIDSGNRNEIIEELGDYLFQVILQAQVAADQKQFDLESVLRILNDKMIRRHPHVFAGTEQSPINSEKVLENWDEIKRNEKPDSIFRLPKNLPALQYAHKLGAKSARWKFDWSHESGVPTALRVLEKVDEELNELKEALETWLKAAPTKSWEPFHQALEAKNPEALHLVHEMGDILFALAQLARHLGFQAEDSLRGCNHRFENRFETMLDIGKHNQESFQKLTAEEMENLWLRAKAVTKGKESHGKE